LPMNLEHFTLDNLLYKGHRIKVTWREKKIDQEEEGYCVYIDGKIAAKRDGLERIRLELSRNNQQQPTK
nr:hypothetical protein [Candidatus Sigynarchaeota archaeon]